MITLSIWSLLLFGCSSNKNAYRSSLPEPPPTLTPAFTASQTATVSSKPTGTKIPTLTPTRTQATIIEEQPFMGEGVPVCSGNGVAMPIPADFGIDGTILYQKGINQGMYTLGEKPLKFGRLPVQQAHDYFVFGFSPDDQWLMYWQTTFFPGTDKPYLNDANIHLLSAAGETVEYVLDTTQMQEELGPSWRLLGFGNPTYWMNDRLIFTTVYYQPDNDDIPSRLSSWARVFDPFIGQWNTEVLSSLPGWINHSTFGFSPDLERVLYGGLDGPGLLLLDFKTKRPLWLDSWVGSDSMPNANDGLVQWSPDSELVAYNKDSWNGGDFEIFLLSRNGERQRLIYRSSVFGSYITEISWSPNSRYVAFWGSKETGGELFIYDVANNAYLLRCPVKGYVEQNPSLLIWAPDDSAIAITGWDEPLEIFDISTGSTYLLLEHVSAVGWSKSFPVTWP